MLNTQVLYIPVQSGHHGRRPPHFYSRGLPFWKVREREREREKGREREREGGREREREREREGAGAGERKKVNTKLVRQEHTMQAHTCICLEFPCIFYLC